MNWKYVVYGGIAVQVSLVLLGAFIGSTYSVIWGVLVGLLVPAILFNTLHNRNIFTEKLVEKNDDVIFRLCGDGSVSTLRRIYRLLPSDPRCRVCLVPFGGFGKLMRIRPSRKNPNLCTDCIDATPIGVHEMEAGILHVDIRGFTSWSETHGPDAVAAKLSRFYDIASRVLSKDDSLIEFVGDQVMAVYLPDFPSLGSKTPEIMVRAARRLIQELADPKNAFPLQVGIGVNLGIASVGNVGKGLEKDFTAVGDVVNTAARLQAQAKSGQVVISTGVYTNASSCCEDASPLTFVGKGKSHPMDAFVINVLPDAA